MVRGKGNQHLILSVNECFSQNSMAWILQESKGRNIFEDSCAHYKGCIKFVFKDTELVVYFPLIKPLGNTANRPQVKYGIQLINHHMHFHAGSSCEDVSESGMLYCSDDMRSISENDTTLETDHIPIVWGGLNYVPHKPPPSSPCFHECLDEDDKDIPHTANASEISPAILEVENLPEVCLGLNYIFKKILPVPNLQECNNNDDIDQIDVECLSLSSDTSIWDSGDNSDVADIDGFTWHSGPDSNNLVGRFLIAI